MKTRTNVCVMAFLMSSWIFVACDKPSAEGRMEATEQKLNEVQEDYERERREFVDEVDRRIEKNKRDIEELKQRVRNESNEVRTETEEKIDQLEKKNEELNERARAYRYESKEKWNSFKREFDHDMDQLGKSIADLFNDNKD